MAQRRKIETVFSAIDKMAAPTRAMQNRFRIFSRSVTRNISAISSRFSKMTRSMKKTFSNVTGVMGRSVSFLGGKVGGLAVAFTGLNSGVIGATALLNRMSVTIERLSKSVGLSVRTTEALAAQLSGTRFDFENIIDLVEEMNNKLGETAGLGKVTTPVSEALKILGIRYKEISNLKPEAQFKRIIDATLKMSDAQKAASAADILFGGEANKIIGLLREQNRSLTDVFQSYDALNFRTERSRKGAALFAASFSKLLRIFKAVSFEVAGLVGEALTPLIERFALWVSLNKDLVSFKISKTFDQLKKSIDQSIPTLIDFFKRTQKAVVFIVDHIGTFAKIAQGILALSVGLVVMNTALAVTAVLAGAIAPIPVLLGGLAAAATVLIFNWKVVSAFFKDLWASIRQTFVAGVAFVLKKLQPLLNVFNRLNGMMNVKGLGPTASKDASSFSLDNSRRPDPPLKVAGASIMTPTQQVSRSIEQRSETRTSEVRIVDETNRARVTRPPLAPGVSLVRSGSF